MTIPRPTQAPYNPNNNRTKSMPPNPNQAQPPRMELMPGEVLICEYCTNKGHAIQDCRIRRRANNEPVEPNWRCRICNQIGQHYTQDCPHRITNNNNGNSNGNQTNNAYNEQPRPNGINNPNNNSQGYPTMTYHNQNRNNNVMQPIRQNDNHNGVDPRNNMAEIGLRGGCFRCGGPHLARQCDQANPVAMRPLQSINQNFKNNGYTRTNVRSQPYPGNYRRP
jgi:hypothetical protein